MKIHELLNGICYESQNLDNDIEISDIIYDSRKAVKNTVFVCIRGFKRDSHDFVNDVYSHGTRVFVVEHEVSLPSDAVIIKVKDSRKFLALSSANLFGKPAEKMYTVAITGTKGKTSVSFMLKSIFEAAGHKVGVIGSTGVYVGKDFYDTENSTPESYLLHKYYRIMLDEGCDIAIIEATSQGFMLNRTYGIHFNIGVFTNLSPDHIGEAEHKDFDDYLNCKKIIFTQCDKVVVNSDSDHYERIISNVHSPIITVGSNTNSSYCFSEPQFCMKNNCLETSFKCIEDGIAENIYMNTPGYFSLYNAILAIAVAKDKGISYDAIKNGLSNTSIKGRMEIVPIERSYTVIIDFAHNEFSVKNLFDTIKLYNPKRIISVFGCGGNRSKLRRYAMGEVIGANSDLSIITSDNSRFEKVEDIISDILVGMHKTNGKYTIIHKRSEAIKEALRVATEGDVILLIGKGHEMYEEIEGVKYPFDERQAVRDALCELELQGD